MKPLRQCWDDPIAKSSTFVTSLCHLDGRHLEHYNYRRSFFSVSTVVVVKVVLTKDDFFYRV
jgi:hypothetical protein